MKSVSGAITAAASGKMTVEQARGNILMLLLQKWIKQTAKLNNHGQYRTKEITVETPVFGWLMKPRTRTVELRIASSDILQELMRLQHLPQENRISDRELRLADGNVVFLTMHHSHTFVLDINASGEPIYIYGNYAEQLASELLEGLSCVSGEMEALWEKKYKQALVKQKKVNIDRGMMTGMVDTILSVDNYPYHIEYLATKMKIYVAFDKYYYIVISCNYAHYQDSLESDLRTTVEAFNTLRTLKSDYSIDLKAREDFSWTQPSK